VKYLLITYSGAPPAAAFRTYVESGEVLAGFGLAGPERAKVVRVRAGVRMVTDGPYRATDRHVRGWHLVDVDGEARAWAIAAGLPAARSYGVEVWPVLHGGATGG
jgi:hypothetical protein